MNEMLRPGQRIRARTILCARMLRPTGCASVDIVHLRNPVGEILVCLSDDEFHCIFWEVHPNFPDGTAFFYLVYGGF